MPDEIPDMPMTLDAVLDDAWRLLACGVNDRHHGFRLPTLATTDVNGHADARTVVLRAVDRKAGTICCHTDARSPKVQHLHVTPWASWVFYDREQRVQVRISGETSVLRVEQSPLARDAWERTSPASRRCYLAPHAPSTSSDAPSANLPDHLRDRMPTMEESEAGTEHFRLISTQVAMLEWLRLRHDGHRRACFTWPTQGAIHAGWLEP